MKTSCNDYLDERLGQYTQDGVYYTFYLDVTLSDGAMNVWLSPVEGEHTVHAEKFHLQGVRFAQGVFRTGNCWDCFGIALSNHLLLMAAKGERWKAFGNKPISSLLVLGERNDA